MPVKNALRGGRESEDWGTPKGNPILIKTPQRHQARIYRGDFTERIWAGAREKCPWKKPQKPALRLGTPTLSVALLSPLPAQGQVGCLTGAWQTSFLWLEPVSWL